MGHKEGPKQRQSLEAYGNTQPFERQVLPMANSTRTAARTKPKKPRKDYPLFPHNCGQWAKKVRGKIHYFGVWADAQAALDEWLRVKDELLAGREPRSREGEFTVADICYAFLEYSDGKVTDGDLTQRSFSDYEKACEAIVKAFGRNRSADDIRPTDFAKLRSQLAEGRGPRTLTNWIARCKVVFNFSNSNELTDRPIRYGTYFDKPKAKVIRRDRKQKAHKGEMDLQAKQINELLAIACPQLKAMILLATNVGIGNADLGRMTFDDFDLNTGWLDYPRWKTEVSRRAKLWPETIEALRIVIEQRKEPKDDQLENLVFLTHIGKCWHKEGSSTNPISQAFRKLLKASDNYVTGIGFYALRRTFETVAAETKDQPAIDLSMGHEGRDMATLYRQRLRDERLEAVAKHVRKWLFGKRVAK